MCQSGCKCKKPCLTCNCSKKIINNVHVRKEVAYLYEQYYPKEGKAT